MGWIEGSILLFGGLVAVMGLGLPVAFAFLVLNVVGAMLFLGGEPGLAQLARNAVQSITSFSLTPIPFFVLMGEVLFHTGVALKAIDAFALLIRRVPGRLSVIAIVAGTVFSAISGSTIATTALLGSLMLPTMLARGYEPRMAMGPIMGIGGVDMLIPPSALTVLLGSLAGISIAGLLIGGIVPGLILSALYVGYIIARATINPALAPDEPVEEGPRGAARWLPFVTHVRAAGPHLRARDRRHDRRLGDADGSRRHRRRRHHRRRRALSQPDLRQPDEGAHRHRRRVRHHPVHHRRRHHLRAGAELLRRGQRFDRAGDGTGAFGQRARDRDAADPAVPRLLRRSGQHDADHLPFFMPLVQRYDIDPIWFGVLFLICMQLGLLTPPFGLLLFTMKGVAPPSITMQQIYMASMPYIAMSLVILVLIFFFPAIATWLPAVLSR